MAPRLINRNRGLLRQAGWGVADQAVSSTTNFALTVIVARSLSAPDFGAFALVYATYTFILGLAQSVASEPLLVRFSAEDQATARTGGARALGLAVDVGAVVGAIGVVIGVLVRGPIGSGLVVVGLALPLLLLQDGLRFFFFAAARPVQAFVNDTVWGVLQLVATSAIVLWGTPSVGRLMAAWAGAGAVAAGIGLAQARLVPRLGATPQWVRDHRDLAPRFFTEFIAVSGAAQLSLYLVGIVSGLAAAGALRAAVVVFGPVNIVLNAMRIAAIPAMVRVRRVRRQLVQVVIATSAFAGTCALAWTAVALVTPDRIGRNLFGESWALAAPLFVAVGVQRIAVGLSAGTFGGLRALGAADRSLRVRLILGAISIVTGVAGAVVDGARGAAVGLAAAAAVAAVLWAWEFALECRDGSPEAEPQPTPAVDPTA
jgi:O-antigen/teichoic acid export membrane protein